ncbi:tetraspanin-33-like [Mizuhopecten yessoensis]|uniref:Tetraspanin-33 n=1 Tax=Mizuhopecten yessoensis TaxID=6573 RepID=A0A210R2Q2_MIZYE|nr:tetraspanin-33-like [Mizuhopecten yessoensis]OWF55267.1 Tetraspanin-33 [Mizuhopecten yessoensis]
MTERAEDNTPADLEMTDESDGGASLSLSQSGPLMSRDSLIEEGDTDDVDEIDNEVTSGNGGDFRRKSMPAIMRRLSSIQSTIRTHIRIQNFLLKYILFFFNFLSWVAGLVAVGVGLWSLLDDGGIIADAVDFVLDPSVIILILGAITFIVAFPGCLGAVRENIILLRVFHLSLSLVLVVEIVAGTLIIVFYSDPTARENLRHAPEKVLKKAIVRYKDDDYYKVWMDNVQKQFKCCGVSHTDEGYKDWQLNIYFNCTRLNPSIERCAVPFSCCIFYPGERINVMCGFGKTNKSKSDVEDWIYTQGCVKGFGEWLGKHEQIILLTAGGVMAMQLLGVIFARIFVKRVTKQRARWKQIRRRQQRTPT